MIRTVVSTNNSFNPDKLEKFCNKRGGGNGLDNIIIHTYKMYVFLLA